MTDILFYDNVGTVRLGKYHVDLMFDDGSWRTLGTDVRKIEYQHGWLKVSLGQPTKVVIYTQQVTIAPTNINET